MTSPAAAMDSEQRAHFLLSVVEDRKAVEPVLLDLRGKTLLFDYCLVCSGTSNVHIRAIADAVLEKSADARLGKPRATGEESAEWVLLDFGDVVLHILDEDSRARYQLEKFWSTPQPKGALPPTPESLRAAAVRTADDPDAVDLDEEDRADADFFDAADQEVEPIDEDDLDDLDDEDLDDLDDEDMDDSDDEDMEELDEDEDDENDDEDLLRQPR